MSARPDFDGHPLPDMLDAAVPLWMHKLRDVPAGKLLERLHSEGLAQLVASKGDVLLFGSKTKGEASALFNRLAEGIAILALPVPGGVTLFGRTWRKEP